MATTSPSPNSSPSAIPPASVTSPPPSQPSVSTPPPSQPSGSTLPSQPSVSSPPPSQPSNSTSPPNPSVSPPNPPTFSSPSQSNADPPVSTPPSIPSPPPQSSSSNQTAPPPATSSPPPPPSLNSPPPSTSNLPLPPTSNSPPPSTSKPPEISPPPPPSKPPPNSPPPPSAKTPQSSPPPETPPSVRPPENSPPPPSTMPGPTTSPPPPLSTASKISPPPPALVPPSNSPPPPPRDTPTPQSQPGQSSPPPSVSGPKSSPPPPVVRLAPPPSLVDSPPSPSETPITPSGNGITNRTSPSASESSNNAGNAGIGTGGIVAIGVVAGILMLSVVGLVVWCIGKRKKKVSGLGGYVLPSSLGSSPRSALIGNGSGNYFMHSSSEPGGLGHSRSFFAYEELVEATNGFSSQNLLGEGGFGFVYKGYLPDGREIAVKELKIGGGQGEREFKAEVEIISRIHHRHLVSLVGYCISENRRLLVYDYVPNNNLYYHLNGEGRPVLDWEKRVKIAAGAARGIAYLHEDCDPRIIHRDIKSSNILLDNNFEARVSDFGLAKLALDADTHITTRVIGTFGYVAPEYASSGKLTEKSDVYSFGVVLLELITGRKPVDASQPVGNESLVEWARPLLSHALDTQQFEDLVDPKLEKKYVESEVFRMIEVAAACVRHSAAKRPRMGQVVRAFDSLATIDLSNGMRIGESEAFDPAEQSAEIRLFRRMAFGNQDYSTEFFSHSSFHS